MPRRAELAALALLLVPCAGCGGDGDLSRLLREQNDALAAAEREARESARALEREATLREAAQSRLAEVEAELAQSSDSALRDELERAEEALAESERGREELIDELVQMREGLVELEAMRLEALARVESADTEYEAARERRAELEREKAEAERERDALHERVRGIAADLERANLDNAQLRASVQGIQETLGEYQAVVEELVQQDADGGASVASEEGEEADEVRAALAKTLVELERVDGERRALAARVEELEVELASEQELRFAREMEWLEYNQFVASLDIQALAAQIGFPVDHELLGLTEQDLEPAPEDPPEVDPAVERASRLVSKMRALLRAELRTGFDPLELGRVVDGACGPVVFRLLDDRGRLSGSLYAERLWLECSRSGRTVTFVLHDGYESRGGERFPFQLGERRITFHHVDPEDWLSELPELFPEGVGARVVDDGQWDRGGVRRELNALLRLDAAGGYYGVRRFDGVNDGELIYVSLHEYGREGQVVRHIAADRMRIERAAGGIRLVLRDGVSIRGNVAAPFLDGVMRIVLPRADADDWVAAGLPVLEPDDGPAGTPEESPSEASTP